MANGPAFALGAQDAAFLRIEFLSISAASRGPDNVPSLARALGCRLSSDLRQITLFFSSSDARELLAHIGLNGTIAAVFAVPSTHQALQLKGVDARVEKTGKNDLKLVSSYRQAFVDHVGELGYPRDLIEALLFCEPDDLAAVTFSPSAAFSQTPGPRAGQAIGVTR
jgi:hypothetical protein